MTIDEIKRELYTHLQSYLFVPFPGEDDIGCHQLVFDYGDTTITIMVESETDELTDGHLIEAHNGVQSMLKKMR